jgi:spermidine synthase
VAESLRGAKPKADLRRLLFFSAFMIATSGLIYELVAGALASYLLGDSVTQFSLIIGTYLSAMGLGSYLSRFIDRALISRFVEIEIAIALVGGFEAPLLWTAFVYTPAFQPLLFALVAIVGTLVGVELPLLMRILERDTSLKELVARVLFLDYIGALFAAVLFPLWLVPQLGLFRTSLFFGLANAAIALILALAIQADHPARTRLRVLSASAIVVLLAAFAVAGEVEKRLESDLFADPVVLREVTPYQRIVLTHRNGDTRLFLNGALQFSSVDEYRYHEALVHAGLGAIDAPKHVMVLGGGDGLAVREILKYPSVESVLLIDLDPAMTRLFRDRPELSALNDRSLMDPRVEIHNVDAFAFLRETSPTPQDAIIVDLPDPNSYGLGKLYTTHFYRLIARWLAPDGVLTVQSTSPMFAKRSFWCIVETIAHEGFWTQPYHIFLPSFGEWGFVLAGKGRVPNDWQLPEGLRFLDSNTLATLFHFPPDMARIESPINR